MPCTDCVGETIGWGPTGGLVAYNESSALSPCRTFTHVRTAAGEPGPDKQCSVEIGGCDTETDGLHALETALAHPDVTAAFAGSVPVYGTDPRPCDGSVLAITRGDKTILVGGDCGTGTSCIQGQQCTEVPAGVRALADALAAVELAAMKKPDCSSVFP
ncbi:MAG: hypothetical protein U0359_26475 [Byssovorax sp.]